MTTPAGGVRRGLPVLAVGAGLLAAAVGLGLGPRHGAVEGPTTSAVLGWALLVVGLLGAGWGAVRLLRSVRRRWWAPVLAALLLTTYLCSWTVGQAVAATHPPRPELGDRTPASVGLVHRDVTFPSADGVRLAGWYVPSRNGASVAVMHGAGSTRSAVLGHAAALAEDGFGVLLFDARGHGESAGSGMDFGWYGEADARGAVDFLVAQPDVATGRVGLVGLSMGGEEAIGAAGADERVGAVVAEGATHRVAADKGYLAAYGVRGEVQQGIDHLTYAVVDLLTPAPEPSTLRDSVATATSRAQPTHFLLIAGGLVEPEELAVDHVRGSSPHVQTWTVPDAGHTGGLRTAGEEWQRRVTTFLERTLLQDPASVG